MTVHHSSFTWSTSRFMDTLSGIVSRPSGAVGLFLVLANILLAVISPLIVPYDFKAVNANSILDPPSWQHWLPPFQHHLQANRAGLDAAQSFGEVKVWLWEWV